jgi:gliding motility-associated-like protein
MKKWVLLYFALCLFTLSKSQTNLVPNWSFEDIISCPTNANGNTTIILATPWQNPTQGTPDLFSSCDTIIQPMQMYPSNGTPNNAAGYQKPHSGNNYGGIEDWEPSYHVNAREYIQAQLIDTLVKNKKYCVSFFSSLAENSSYITSRLGCLISKLPVSLSTSNNINAVPQIQNPFHNYISDTTNWIEIKGMYIAIGGENYITIGNFFDDANTDTIYVGGMYPWEKGTYYYLDDVSLTEYDNAYAGIDSRQCKGTAVVLGTENATGAFGASYNWSVLSGDKGSITDSLFISAVVTPKVTTTYVLQKQQCGISSYDTVTVYIKPNYSANAGKDTSICIGDSAILGVNNCNWCNYTWQNIPAPYTHIPVLTVYPLASTMYTVILKDSCFTTGSSVKITVDYCQSPVISVPNIFTPNGDGINDSWQLTVSSGELSIINYDCTIYDRWGAKVFETTAVLTGWDGHTTSGLAATEGTYYYVINYTDAKTGTNKNLKGFLELVR